MKKDLIDRQELLKAIDTSPKMVHDFYIEDVMAVVLEQPQADTERHAHWIDINEVSAKCSNCENFILRCDTNNYCPNCGCKMDEVVE